MHYKPSAGPEAAGQHDAPRNVRLLERRRIRDGYLILSRENRNGTHFLEIPTHGIDGFAGWLFLLDFGSLLRPAFCGLLLRASFRSVPPASVESMSTSPSIVTT